MRLTLLALLAAALPAAAGDIKLPVMGQAKAEVVGRLTTDRLYIVQSDTQLFVRSFPDGIVAVRATEGPQTVFAKFADSDGDYEERVFKAKFLYFVRPIKSGTATLVLVPKGVLSEDEITTQTLDVEAGVGPRPPPGPSGPDDPLFPPIKAAYDKAPDGPALTKLTALYRELDKLDLTAYPTAGALRAAVSKKAEEAKLGSDDLRAVRTVIQGELENFLPKLADAQLTQDHRANAKSTFARVLLCLEALGVSK